MTLIFFAEKKSRMTERMGLSSISRRLAFLAVAGVLFGTGCGGGSTFNVQNPPPPPQRQISIAFQPAPSTSMPVGSTTSLTAVVNNDPTNSGVDWIVTCQNNICGSVSPQHTSSNQPTTYTPPATLPGNSQSVDIAAFATANHTQNVLAPVTITAFGNNFLGTYILQAQGIDATSGQPYEFVGAITLDGNGGISGGEQTVDFVDPNVGTLLSKSDAVTGGTYFVGSDGRGVITVKTNDPDVGVSGTETFSFVFLSASQAVIAQLDSTASAQGTMDLQTSIAAPLGGYAFVVSGVDVASTLPTAFGGVFNIDSSNTISGAGSVSDQNLAGTLTQNSPVSGTVGNPDSFGAVAITLNIGFGTAQLTGYMVDPAHMKLIETDNTTGTGFGSTGGLAISQGAATGTFNSLSLFSGNYVFNSFGTEIDSGAPGLPASMTSVGVLTSDGAGNLTSGFTDTLFQGSCVQKTCTQGGITGAQISAAFTGRYTMLLNGIGRVRVTPSVFTPPPSPALHHLYIFYLTGGGTPALVLDGGDLTGLQSYASVGAGIAYPQASAPFTFAGKYGFSLTQQNGSESDGTGEFSADSNALTLAGFMDTTSSPGSAFSGTFAVPGADGTFAGSLSGTGFEFRSPANSAWAADFYTIDSNRGFFIETDLTNSTSPSSTVSLGYYAARTAVCAGCP